MELLYDPEIPFLCIYSKVIKTLTRKYIRIPIFIAVLFIQHNRQDMEAT